MLRQAAGQHGAHAKLSADRHGIVFPALVTKHRTARDHTKIRQLREVIDDAFSKTIRNPVVTGILVLKRNHRNRLN